MSRIARRVVLMLALATMVGGPGIARSQRPAPGSPPDPLAGLKVGQWVKLEGGARGASPAPCTAVKLLTGDFLDDDWSLKGTVASVDAGRREFTVSGCRIQVNENTLYDSDRPGFRAFADLRPGTYVEVDGTFLKNRLFLATEVADESDEVARQPRLREQLQLVGRVERVDARTRVISIMGMDFQVTAKTQIRSPIR